MSEFEPRIIELAASEKEVELTTYGRRSGEPSRVVVWLSTDGRRLFIRSGGGLGRHWPQNLLARPQAVLHVAGRDLTVGARLETDPTAARHVSQLVKRKYGEGVSASRDGEELTPGESATFELLPG